MGFIFGSNGKGRNKLTQEELALARTIYNTIRGASSAVDIQELASILSRLDPDALQRLLNLMTINKDAGNIEQLLLESIDIGGTDAIAKIRALAPKLALPAFIPSAVPISNPQAMAGMDFSVVPDWASVKRPKVEFNLSFDKTNPNSLAYAYRRAGQLVTSIDEMTRQSVRKIITDAFNEQIDVRATAKRIKNVVGLHPKWADAVVNFEKREMARLVKMGISEAKARISAQARASAYADQLVSARATMIARTEIQIAQNEGRYEGWKQAADGGYVDPATQKMWITAPDERTCDVCAPLNGEMVPWNGVFSIGLEKPIVHPNCRCTMVLIPPDRGTK